MRSGIHIHGNTNTEMANTKKNDKTPHDQHRTLSENGGSFAPFSTERVPPLCSVSESSSRVRFVYSCPLTSILRHLHLQEGKRRS